MSKKLILHPEISAAERRSYTPQDAIYDWFAGREFYCKDDDMLYTLDDTIELRAAGYECVIIQCGPRSARIELFNKRQRVKDTLGVKPTNRAIYCTDEVALAFGYRR